MTSTHRPHETVDEAPHGSFLFVHVVVSLVLWLLIYAGLRALFFS